MASSEVTFTLDEDTVHRIEEAAERLAKPKSQVLREAISEYYSRIEHSSGRVNESERLEKLRLFDTWVPLIPLRSSDAVDRELKEIREARRSGGRRSFSRKRM